MQNINTDSQQVQTTMSLICSKFEPLYIDEVETLLQAHEARLDKFHKNKSLVSVNLTEGALTSNSTIVQTVEIPNFVLNVPNSLNGNLNNQSFDAQVHLTMQEDIFDIQLVKRPMVMIAIA